jgi:transcriptional regulator with XRE-family HTH domain
MSSGDLNNGRLRQRSRVRRKSHERSLHADGLITKEGLAQALTEVRILQGLKQVDIMRLSHSTHATISRLLSPRGRLPDLRTLARYGGACGLDVGLMFATATVDRLRIHTAITLQSAHVVGPYESLFGREISLDTFQRLHGHAPTSPNLPRSEVLDRKFELDLALALVAARKAVGLSQAKLAQRAGWKAQFACRLESLRAGPPNLTSLARYARACPANLGLVFASQLENRLSILRAVTLQSSGSRPIFEHLSQTTLGLDSGFR